MIWQAVPVHVLLKHTRKRQKASKGGGNKEVEGVGSRIQGNDNAERTDTVDRAGITALRVPRSIQPARQLILSVRVRDDVVDGAVGRLSG
jgi:hypothetical protein